jgi:hypothetical protein
LRSSEIIAYPSLEYKIHLIQKKAILNKIRRILGLKWNISVISKNTLKTEKGIVEEILAKF